MADELERIYTIPLRHAHHGKASKRADRAIKDVRTFLERHMKSEQIWVSNEINETLWARGKYTIPSKIRVRATRFADGVVEVTLPDSATEGSVREAIQERQATKAETPVLAPMDMGDEDDHDDAPVTDVEGIGPATAEKLEAIEITTVGALAHADAKVVAEATGKSEEAAAAWIAAAHELVGHSHDEEE
jgi:large subunit ribosomal protein L31e